MTVSLRNNTGQAIPIMLDHPAFRDRKSGFRRRTQQVTDQARDGTRRPRLVQREEHGTITLPPRGVVGALHPAIRNCSQVRGLLTRGAVSIVEEKPVGASRSAQPAPPPPLSRSTSKRGKSGTMKGANDDS